MHPRSCYRSIMLAAEDKLVGRRTLLPYRATSARPPTRSHLKGLRVAWRRKVVLV